MAVNRVPWLGVGNRGLAVTQDKAGQYSQAMQNLKFFLLTNPPPADAEAANTLRDKIEYRMEKAAKESSPAVIAVKRQDPFEALLKKIDHRRYTAEGPDSVMTVDVRGRTLVWGWIQKDISLYRVLKTAGGRIEIKGCKTTAQNLDPPDFGSVRVLGWTFIISEKGESITVRFSYSDEYTGDSIYVWQR